MTVTENSLTKLISVPTEQEAAIIVASLAEEGIGARTLGDFISTYRIGFPGPVQVMVRSDELPEARRVLQEAQQKSLERDTGPKPASPHLLVRYSFAALILLVLLMEAVYLVSLLIN